MLEEKIERLAEAIEALTQALESGSVGSAGATVNNATTATEGTTEGTTEGKPEPAEKPATGSEQDEQPSRESVRSLCMAIVRKDKAYKPTIKEAIREVGGEMVDDVPEDKLGELKGKLEAMQ